VGPDVHAETFDVPDQPFDALRRWHVVEAAVVVVAPIYSCASCPHFGTVCHPPAATRHSRCSAWDVNADRHGPLWKTCDGLVAY
jgi:hypothetical protein